MVLHNMQVGLAEFITSQLKDTKMHIKKKKSRRSFHLSFSSQITY